MFWLDRKAHRYFIEPLSKIQHIKVAFTEKLTCAAKKSTRNVFNAIKHDCRSITGRNLRKSMHYCGKLQICKVTANEIGNMMYHPIPNNEVWRVKLVEKLLDIHDNISGVFDWNIYEISNSLEYLCTT